MERERLCDWILDEDLLNHLLRGELEDEADSLKQHGFREVPIDLVHPLNLLLTVRVRSFNDAIRAWFECTPKDVLAQVHGSLEDCRVGIVATP